jgi:hypothetical protein
MSHTSPQAVSGNSGNVLPPPSNTQGYVNNLIDSYNALIDNTNASFDSVKGHFALYHAIGNTFKVIIMQTAPNSPGYLTLIFVPVGGNAPNVTMNYNDTFAGLYSLSIPGEYIVIEHIVINFTNSIVQVNLAFGIASTDVTGDYMTNSKNAAEYLYHSDLSTIPKPTPSQPSSQNPDPFAWFNDNPIVKTIGNVLSVVLFVGIIIGALAVVMRKRIKNELKQWLRMDEPPHYRTKNNKAAG